MPRVLPRNLTSSFSLKALDGSGKNPFAVPSNALMKPAELHPSAAKDHRRHVEQRLQGMYSLAYLSDASIAKHPFRVMSAKLM
ncbi:Aste57867_23139 [Aphanomyces stellatus]|uniref:Aste57867_23139 protein n=1 Tax=Aphanomyces stellatus TaxID=120398 RepID=A0A485LNL4_9STRA|nr:hypothetical protein As57867_023068 [Aphanomyces stellatus]VFT99787.1 Aste57867_23139 [Aphanomyces stellatus]